MWVKKWAGSILTVARTLVRACVIFMLRADFSPRHYSHDYRKADFS
jgi:hypothetical protein